MRGLLRSKVLMWFQNTTKGSIGRTKTRKIRATRSQGSFISLVFITPYGLFFYWLRRVHGKKWLLGIILFLCLHVQQSLNAITVCGLLVGKRISVVLAWDKEAPVVISVITRRWHQGLPWKEFSEQTEKGIMMFLKKEIWVWKGNDKKRK